MFIQVLEETIPPENTKYTIQCFKNRQTLIDTQQIPPISNHMSLSNFHHIIVNFAYYLTAHVSLLSGSSDASHPIRPSHITSNFKPLKARVLKHL